MVFPKNCLLENRIIYHPALFFMDDRKKRGEQADTKKYFLIHGTKYVSPKRGSNTLKRICFFPLPRKKV
jgi:hypothetical protein